MDNKITYDKNRELLEFVKNSLMEKLCNHTVLSISDYDLCDIGRINSRVISETIRDEFVIYINNKFQASITCDHTDNDFKNRVKNDVLNMVILKIKQYIIMLEIILKQGE